MTVEKNGKLYVIEEKKTCWKVSYKAGKLTVDYQVEKELCKDEAALRAYIEQEGLF